VPAFFTTQPCAASLNVVHQRRGAVPVLRTTSALPCAAPSWNAACGPRQTTFCRLSPLIRTTLHVSPVRSLYFHRVPATFPVQLRHLRPPRSMLKLSPPVLDTVSSAVPLP